MMRSLYAGVSGLNNHQTKMDVIGNNVSNVNTYGYKKGRATFHDIFSQTISGASRPTVERGGINPKQIGLGMSVASIDVLHTQGSLQTTGVNTDLAIMGSGFFLERTANSSVYTRKGSYSLDANGVLVNPANGFRLQGYGGSVGPDGSSIIDTSGDVGDIVIPIGEKEAAVATTTVRYKSNLSSLIPNIPGVNPTDLDIANGTWATSVNVIDSRGDSQELQLNFSKNIDATGNVVPNQWRVDVQVIDLSGRAVTNLNAGPGGAANSFIVNFNENGSISSLADSNAPAIPLGTVGTNLSTTLSYAVAGSEPMQIQLDLGTAGSYNGITQFASNSSTKAYFQNGVQMGYLTSFAISDKGVITATYDNGSKNALGQVALANFANTGGLEKEGESYFIESNNSGAALITPAGAQGAGKIKSGTLEMSNVDLANEFTDMITTQRGFQANSRTITTSDTMLEELLRLKR